MLVYHNSAACCNTEKKSSKSKSISKSKSKSKGKRKSKSRVPVKKGYKCNGKSKPCVISSKAPSPPGRKKVTTVNKKLSGKNREFLEGLGLKVKKE